MKDVTSGDGAVAVARFGRQRTAAPDGERTQIHIDGDRLLLQVGGSCPHGVMPSSTCGEAHHGDHRLLWIPTQNPLQTAS